jgi:hypothetical protein
LVPEYPGNERTDGYHRLGGRMAAGEASAVCRSLFERLHGAPPSSRLRDRRQ